MALLVFLTFMSLIVDQYVPVWMKDSESAHMNEAVGQFGTLKNNVDSQVLACSMARLAQQTCMRVTTYAPVTLGVDGVPLFASPTYGTMQMNPDEGKVVVNFSYQAGNITDYVNSSSSGTIDLHVYNRYYVQQRIIYENGAVLVYQYDGQLVSIAPHFIVDNMTSHIEISLSQIWLMGSGGSSGVSTEGVQSRLNNAEFDRFINLTSDFNITLLTEYEKAWFHFYNNTLFESFGDPEILEMAGTPTSFIRTQYFELSYNINQGYARVRIYNDSGFPISVVRLITSNFDVSIGETAGRT